MIKYLAGKKYKKALERRPNTPEFKVIREIEVGEDVSKGGLVSAAIAALAIQIESRPDRETGPIVADLLYEPVLGDFKLLDRWEATFGDGDEGRKLFALVVWTFFFDQESKTWLAVPSETEGIGKRGWIYLAEPEPQVARDEPDEPRPEAASFAPPAQPELDEAGEVFGPPAVLHDGGMGRGLTLLPDETAGLVVNQCVCWTTQGSFGRIVGPPRADPDDFMSTQQRVRFAPLMGEPAAMREKWIDTPNLEVSDQENCRTIEPA